MSDLVIKNTKLLINNKIQPAEISIEDGKIKEIKKIISAESFDEKIDAKGSLIVPGAIDIHVHFRDPGLTKKEDWYSGSCSAAAGGVTTVIDHPNTRPPVTDIDSFKKKQKSAKKSIIDYGINAGVIQNLSSLKELWELGVSGFGEIFMTDIDEQIFKKSLEIIHNLTALPCIHAEDEKTIKKFEKLLKNSQDPSSYSKSRPNISEKIAVQKAINFSNGNKIHFCHISTHESVEIIKKERINKKISCEVTPHHLFLSTKDWDRLGTFGKMNPPLRDFVSQKSLWNGLNNGIIDIVASDHAPHLESEKDTDIWDAPAGVPGVETMLPLMLMAVKRNLITLKKMIEVTSRNPAKLFNLNKGMIAQGYDADIVIIGDITEIKKEKLHSKAKWTPYQGKKAIFPKVTISRGEIIYEDGIITGKRNRGEFIKGMGFNKINF